MLTYWYQIERDENGNIISAYSPDFNLELIPSDNSLENATDEDITKYVGGIYRALLANNATPPLTFSEVSLSTGQNSNWCRVNINNLQSDSILVKVLPRLGYIFSVCALLGTTFVSYMALSIASHNEKDNTTSLILSLSGTAFSACINLIIYLMSGATEMLQRLGAILSDKTYRSQFISNELRVSKHNKKNGPTDNQLYTWISIAEIAIITNISINTIIAFQEQLLLADRFLSLYPELSHEQRNLYYALIKWIVVIAANLMGNYCELAFENFFAFELIKKAQLLFSDKKPSYMRPFGNHLSLLFQPSDTEEIEHSLMMSFEQDDLCHA